jgi:hypothetical protein
LVILSVEIIYSNSFKDELAVHVEIWIDASYSALEENGASLPKSMVVELTCIRFMTEP